MARNLLDLLLGSAGALLLSLAARWLPRPAAPGARFYRWFYRFAHFLLANFDKVEIANDVQSGSH